MAKLIIARHHESEWNKTGQWTGIRDRHLTEYGFQKSAEMGLLIRDIPIHAAFASMQVRSIETLSCMLEAQELTHIPTVHASSLNERDYGDYTGKDKWQMHDLLGEEQWNRVRREWDYPVPNGESLRTVYERVVPFFKEHVLPLLNGTACDDKGCRIEGGRNVLMVFHGNAIRALIKYIEGISDEKIADLEMLFGGIIIYELDEDGHMLTKEMRQVESSVHA